MTNHQGIWKLTGAAAFALLLLALATLTPATPAAATTVEEVIAKHVEARGGAGWDAIESLKASGSFTSFSTVAPFTYVKKRGYKYHLESAMNGHPIEIAHDGETAWQINSMFQVPWAQKIGGLDHQVLMLDADLATPFFDYQERGYTAELKGRTEIDGQEVIEVALTHPDETVETWYLDADTYLEVARDAPGSDFGRPAPQRTFFDDFRQVDGVTIPHYHETQWYTRTRIYEIDTVETNVEVDDAIFAMPPPEGMDKLMPMAGEWQVKVEQRSRPGAPWDESERTTTVESLMGGALVRQQVVTSQGNAVETSLSYDRFRERYVLTAINDFTSHMDIQEGTFDDQGRLTVSNVETGTSWSGFGRTFHERNSYFDIGEDGFKVEQETSVDGGESWFVNAKLTYTRASDSATD